ncbi:MAG: AI-2E family transporter [Caldilineae bacterium]|nr:AI-2E family transporter [Anaerolineae bacterium]MCB0252658.1 AI-2E family transporter [Anaerolineae bacterium]MCB9154992.1 AI-2E family transporter [Caldilineae bacterium]
MTAAQPPAWNRDTKRIVAVAVLITSLALVYLARGVIPQLVLAGVLAYLFQPIVGGLARRRVPRGLAAACCLLILILLVAVVPILLLPATIQSVGAIIDVFSRIPELTTALDNVVEKAPTINLLNNQIDLGAMILAGQSSLEHNLQEFQLPDIQALISYGLEGLRAATNVVRTAADIASVVISVVLTGLLLLVYTFYLTKDGNQLTLWFTQLITPAYHDEMQELGHRLNLTWKRFFRGQLLLSLTVGTVVFLATTLLGLPGALILGFLAGVLEVIPNLGPVLALIPAVIIALIQGPSYLPVGNLVFAGIVVAVYVVIQQLENNILVPRIMGHSLNLHPLVVLVGVVVGASFAGILGAFLAAPTLASIKILGWYAHAKLTDRHPFPKHIADTDIDPTAMYPVTSAAENGSDDAVALEQPARETTPVISDSPASIAQQSEKIA